MSLTVGTNSWVTITEANTFLGDRYGASSWASLTDSDKSALLITAFWHIYSNKDYTIAKTETNELVKNAQIITAFYIYENNSQIKKRLALQGQGVFEFQVSKFMEKLSNGSWIPIEAQSLLDDWIDFDVIVTVERELD